MNLNLLSSFVWKAVAGAAIAALFVGLWLRGENYAARARSSEILLKGAIAVGNANAEAARAQARIARKIDAVEAVRALRARELRTRSDTRRKEIIDARPDTDGPLAPVLRHQLDRLPERPGADPNRDTAAAGDSAGAALAR